MADLRRRGRSGNAGVHHRAALAAALLSAAGLVASLSAAALAAEPLRVFNIDAYVLDDALPDCRNLGGLIVPPIGLFPSYLTITQIIKQLANKTLERGGNAMHSIRIQERPPGGFEVSAVAANCMQEPLAGSERSPLPFDPGLIETVRAANEALAFSFPQSGRLDPARSVSTVTTAPRSRLSTAQLAGLKNIVLSPETYPPPGLAKSCAFEPSFGVQMKTSTADAWWLVSLACQTGTLVRADTNWLRTQIVPIAQPAMDRLIALARELGLPEK